MKRCLDDDNSEFFVYKLVPVEGCAAAYCAGIGKPCENGEVWDEDQEVCVEGGC